MPSTASLPCNPDKYSAKCIAQVAAAAGFNKTESMLSTAVAVALAESSGRTKVVNSIGCCVGLWQINVEVHPYSTTQMQDPAQNAAAAFKISKQGSTWKPWSAYTNGAYLLHLPAATVAAKAVGTTTTPIRESIAGDAYDDLVDDIGNPLDGLMQPVVAVKDWISDRNNIFRIMKVVGGVAITLVGINLIAKQPVQTVIKELKK